MHQQYVIAYTLDGQTHIYDSAYRPSQVSDAIKRCRAEHGDVRPIRADLLAPTEAEQAP
jgi:hypothetical protein